MPIVGALIGKHLQRLRRIVIIQNEEVMQCANYECNQNWSIKKISNHIIIILCILAAY